MSLNDLYCVFASCVQTPGAVGSIVVQTAPGAAYTLSAELTDIIIIVPSIIVVNRNGVLDIFICLFKFYKHNDLNLLKIFMICFLNNN